MLYLCSSHNKTIINFCLVIYYCEARSLPILGLDTQPNSGGIHAPFTKYIMHLSEIKRYIAK